MKRQTNTNHTLIEARKMVNPNNQEFNLVVEFGSYMGSTLRQLRELFPHPDYTLIGCDSLQGLPEDWRDGEGKLVGSGRKGRFGEGATRRWYDGIDNLKFYEGFFKDSIKPFLRDYMDCPAALVHIDCDLYSSTNDVLYPLWDYGVIVPGTILVFDEWYYNHENVEKNTVHEKKAFYEWVESNPEMRYQLVDMVEDERRIVKIL